MKYITTNNSDTYILTDREKETLKEAQNIITQLDNCAGYLNLYWLTDYEYEAEFNDLIGMIQKIIDNDDTEFVFEGY